MNPYELMFLIDPDLEDEAVKNEVAAVKEAITGAGGEIQDERLMGKRRLAYRIQKRSEGLYVLIHFLAPPTAIEEIDHLLAINDRVLRHQIVRPQHQSLPVEQPGR